MSAAFDRRPAFWIAYAMVAALALALAWRLFPQAIPLVNLEITMTRAAAIARAEALAKQYKLAPEGARTAIVFNQDGVTQNYVELEGGGKEAFAKLVAGKLYAPYWWDVRLFKPGVIDEVLIRFRPDGARNGFVRRIAETYVRDPSTKALTTDAALTLARTRATEDWNVDLAPYRLLDQAQQTRPSGRVDHQFVFEREEAIGEARIRLRLLVSGDELTALEPFVHVPESFNRRYQEMRSTNNAIAGLASITAGVLYGLVGCILGALWLLRRRYLVWKGPILAGLVIAGLGAAALLANAPTAWFGFDTAQDESTFWIRQAGLVSLALVGGSLALGEAFMAAEGLSRRAFPDHPQLWRVGSRAAGATREIVGRTAGGYLFVPVELGFVAVFYYVTNRYLGWWQPSEQLTDPNILASAMPALSPIAMALQAGMLEECVFRAVPLAMGALIGANYGRRNAGIAVAFVLQAIIFGAAHANYPGFPPYSRLVELVVPSLMWAAIFLRYGLLPTILLHTLFDLVLMSIPVFLMEAPGADLQRGVVILAALVPAIVIAFRAFQNRGFGTLPDALRNGAWSPAPEVPVAAERTRAVDGIDRRAMMLQRGLPVLGIAGLVAWFAYTPLRSDAPPLLVGRDVAMSAALAAVTERGMVPGPEWTQLAVPRSAAEEGSQRQWHAFVWREAGPQAYRALVGNALAPPLWEVRFARFEGDVADRAEEWRVTVDSDGRVRQVVHALPEGRRGATLSREEAQQLAERTLFRQLGTDASMLVLRGADQQKKPARLDWVFSFADPRVNVGKDGEARVQVAIAGDEVVSAGRSLFVPEAWQRAETERDSRRQLARMVSIGFIALCAIAALVYAVNAWNKGRSDRRALWTMVLVVFVMLVAGSVNNWPLSAFQLRTTEPVASQVLIAVLTAATGALLFALLLGLLAGVGMHYARAQQPVPLVSRVPAWAAGVMAACATAGIAAAMSALVPPMMPTWPNLKQMASAWSWFAAVLGGVAVLPGVAITLFLLSVVDRATAGWTRRVWVVGVALVLIGIAVAVPSGRDIWQALLQGAVEGGTTFAFAWLVMRYDLRSVPAFVATGLLLEALSVASLRATVEGWGSFVATALTAFVLAWLATKYFSNRRQPA